LIFDATLDQCYWRKLRPLSPPLSHEVLKTFQRKIACNFPLSSLGLFRLNGPV